MMCIDNVYPYLNGLCLCGKKYYYTPVYFKIQKYQMVYLHLLERYGIFGSILTA